MMSATIDPSYAQGWQVHASAQQWEGSTQFINDSVVQYCYIMHEKLQICICGMDRLSLVDCFWTFAKQVDIP